MDLTTIFTTLVMLGLVLTSAIFQLRALTWTGLLGAYLVVLTVSGYSSAALLVIFWIFYLAAAAFANLTVLRRRYLVGSLLPLLKKQMPVISNTEREALEAGNTWWEKELFCGRPNWKPLFSIPKPTLTTDEKHFLDNQVETLCSMLDDWQIVFKDRDLSPEVWNYIKKERFFGLVIPKQYGGLGF